MIPRAGWLPAIPMLLIGCVESLSLGSECSESRASKCAEQMAPRTSSSVDGQAGPVVRPAQPDGGRSPGLPPSDPASNEPQEQDDIPQVMGDADADAPSENSLPPGDIANYVENGTFNLNRGRGGPLGFEAAEIVSVGLNLAAPWSACRPGFSGVDSTLSLRGDASSEEVRSADQSTFIEATIGNDDFSGLAQPLRQPLQQGERVSFLIDVRASAGEEVALEFWSSIVPCVPALPLFATPKVDDTWRSECVSFVPAADVLELVIKATGKSGARAFFDNIRSDPSCP